MGIIVSSHRFPSDQMPSSDVISKITLNVRLPLPNIQNQRFWEACIKVLPSARNWSNVSTIKNMAYSYMKPNMNKLNRTAIYVGCPCRLQHYRAYISFFILLLQASWIQFPACISGSLQPMDPTIAQENLTPSSGLHKHCTHLHKPTLRQTFTHTSNIKTFKHLLFIGFKVEFDITLTF